LDARVKQITTGGTKAVQKMNLYQLEHNELVQEFQIAQQEVRELETILTNKERDIEEIREVSEAELKVYQRKVKHFMATSQKQFSQAYYKNEQELFLERQQRQLEASGPERTANELRSDTNNLQLKNETLMTNRWMKQDRLFDDKDHIDQHLECATDPPPKETGTN
jgi:DNA gyrase/topoisomerase IV subunit A